MQPQDTLSSKAASLARSSPHQWAEFIAELTVFTDKHRDAAIQSPPELLQVCQGRAQALSSLLRTLKECETVAERIKNAQKGN